MGEVEADEEHDDEYVVVAGYFPSAVKPSV